MAGVVVVSANSSQAAIEALYSGSKGKTDPAIASFEKEVDFILQPVLKKARKPVLSPEANQKL